MSKDKAKEESEFMVGLLQPDKESFLNDAQRIEIYYDARIDVRSKKENKTILQRQNGLIQAATFTAILGPSGSGKTTLLNFLSGRLMSENLVVEGELRFNSVPIKSVEPFSNQIGYVMQEDALLGMLTPRECFQFASDLKLVSSKKEKEKVVNDLIKQLGLSTCADVKVGNAFVKGISGGQRKRTSIGVELITNPSVIFLDEPTTGLDSTTALQVILLLKNLAKEGKTVISTIHQPSSELFCEFDRLMLLVDGRCIYQGPAEDANGHFEAQGYKCPQLMNASEFYLDMMSITEAEDLGEGETYEEARAKHDEKILTFEKAYLSSKYHNFKENIDYDPVVVQNKREISFFYEMYLIASRAFLCLIRNPMDAGFKLMQAVFTALIVLVVFGKIDNTIAQNVRGVVFFLVASNAFAGIQGTLATFSTERAVFLRERFSKSYRTFTYFVARTGINFPFELVYPTVGALIVYWATNLGHQNFDQCLQILIMVNSVYFCSASYGLLYAALIPKLETAMALVPVLIIPFMLLGGFFINLNDIHDARVVFYPIMYMSPFKYGFQTGMAALGISSEKESRTPELIWQNIVILLGIGVALRLISIFCMQKISNPKRPNMLNFSQSNISCDQMIKK